jgi:hypothetical protein
MSQQCIQCSRSSADLGHGTIFLTRKRPMGPGSYELCVECARRVRGEQDERARLADEQAERSGV